MTRKEAIANLNMISVAFVDPVTKEQRKLINDTFEMAIKALSQEPTKREIEREYLFQSLCEDFKKLQAENDDLRKRLEQEPCDDTISREAVKDILNNSYSLTDAEHRVEQLPSVTQKPIECDDTVSRQAVIKRLKKEDKILYTPTGLNYLIRAIEDLPPVTQKSETVTEFADRCRECGKMRKGHWIYDETIENWRCSKCNETPKTMGYVGTADFMAEHFKFCNHCGAKMESEVNNG